MEGTSKRKTQDLDYLLPKFMDPLREVKNVDFGASLGFVSTMEVHHSALPFKRELFRERKDGRERV